VSRLSSQDDRLHVVGGQHPRLAGPVNCPRHPALVNEGGVDDDIPVPEAHLVHVLALVVIHGPVTASSLGDPATGMTRSCCTLLTRARVGDSAPAVSAVVIADPFASVVAEAVVVFVVAVVAASAFAALVVSVVVDTRLAAVTAVVADTVVVVEDYCKVEARSRCIHCPVHSPD